MATVVRRSAEFRRTARAGLGHGLPITTGVVTTEASRRQLARDAALRLHDAVRTLRQHPHHQVLCRTAVRRGTEAVLAATGDGPLRLHLGDGTASVDGEELFPFAAQQPPFGTLRAAGIGELVLPRGIHAAAVERLLRALAATGHDDPGYDPAAALREAAPEVHLRAATVDDAVADHEAPRADWWLLPPPAPAAMRLQPSIERALHDNLPARCARQLFADLDEQGAGATEALQPLFATLLARGDLATAAWLLEQAHHHAAVPRDLLAAMQTLATGHCDETRLRALFASAPREQLLDLLTLVMQLGSDATERLARLAWELRHPLADWIDELLGRRS